MRKTLSFLAAITLITSLPGCAHKPVIQKASPPAEVKNPVPEPQLTSVTLTPQAEKRLGIQLAAIKSQNISRTLTQHGEILAVPGFTVTVSAPVTGKLSGAL
jgi:hypothetical protein